MTRRSKRRHVALSLRVKWGFALIACCLFAMGIFLGVEFAKPPPPPDFGAPSETPTDSVFPAPQETPPPSAQPVAETSPRVTPPSTPPASPASAPVVSSTPSPATPLGGKPRIAIVIDDLGRSLQDLKTLRGLGVPVTYAVLPFETLTTQVVQELRRHGEEILCHLPMEAKGGNNPGPGALLSSMNRDELKAATSRALDAVPGARGVNNHMGSSISSSQEAIAPVLEVVAQRGLYFLDSRTSADTVGFSTAVKMGVPASERQVFLDTDRSKAAIRKQFQRLLEVARKRGQAIAIGHPYPETLEILQQEVPQAAGEIEFVRASDLLSRG